MKKNRENDKERGGGGAVCVIDFAPLLGDHAATGAGANLMRFRRPAPADLRDSDALRDGSAVPASVAGTGAPYPLRALYAVAHLLAACEMPPASTGAPVRVVSCGRAGFAGWMDFAGAQPDVFAYITGRFSRAFFGGRDLLSGIEASK